MGIFLSGEKASNHESGTTASAKTGTTRSSTSQPRLRLGAKAIEAYATSLWQDRKEALTVKLLSIKFNKDPKYCKRAIHALVQSGILITIKGDRHCPQWYYPSAFASEVYADRAEKAKTGTTQPLGVGALRTLPKKPKAPVLPEQESLLAAYDILSRLHLLTVTPLMLHNLHFKTQYPPDRYEELDIAAIGKGAKVVRYHVLGSSVTFVFYPKGSVIMTTENTKAPFHFDNEQDHTRLFSYLGAVRFKLSQIINDPRSRNSPDIMDWYFTYAEKNKDLGADHSWHLHAFDLQVKHLDFALKFYIKDMGASTVERIETTAAIDKQKKLLQAINDHLNPIAPLGRIEEKQATILSAIERLAASQETMTNTMSRFVDIFTNSVNAAAKTGQEPPQRTDKNPSVGYIA